MNRRMLAGLFSVLCCVSAALLFQPASDAKGGGAAYQSRRQQVTGTVVGVGGRLGGRSLPFTLTINDYTSPGDVQRLNDALRSGEDELLRALSRLNAGRIALGQNVGVTANAVISTPQAEGGTKLTVLYERNVRFFELRYGTRSQDYRFGYAEIFLDARGRGQGTFIPAARVRLADNNTWEVIDFGEFPARIMGVRSTGRVPAR